jgi:hypothetical protein
LIPLTDPAAPSATTDYTIGGFAAEKSVHPIIIEVAADWTLVCYNFSLGIWLSYVRGALLEQILTAMRRKDTL